MDFIQGRQNEFFLGEAQNNFSLYLANFTKLPCSKCLDFGEAVALPTSPVSTPLIIFVYIY